MRDTNNNPPTFLLPPDEDEFFFSIAAPVPPGYELTGCLNDLIVRDIDLTTEKIIFEIEENPYFEIEREVFASTDTPKNFNAIIRTKTFIRSIPEPIRLKISATVRFLFESEMLNLKDLILEFRYILPFTRKWS